MKDDKGRDRKARLPYVKPEHKPIDLLAGEVLAVGCKNSPIGPGELGTCNFGGTPCPSLGS
jgi:hypothetical protein